MGEVLRHQRIVLADGFFDDISGDRFNVERIAKVLYEKAQRTIAKCSVIALLFDLDVTLTMSGHSA
jgi:hypothetical protein